MLLCAREWEVKVYAKSQAVYPLHEFLGMVVICPVYEAADTDVAAVVQHLWHGEHSVSATSPVMVAHLASVHWPYASSRVYVILCGGVYLAVLEGCEY